MPITQEELERAGYHVTAAPVDEWRAYDAAHPTPRYFDFDWISARHPDLYHRFALSTDGLMAELPKLVDLTGLDVVDVCAGTGRSTMGAAQRAKQVTACDVFAGAAGYGWARIREAGLKNVTYTRGSFQTLPFAANTFDAVTTAWGWYSHEEAYRVLRPGGYIIFMGAPLDALCGELTPVLASEFPHIITEVGPLNWLEPGCPAEDISTWDETWNGVPVIPPVRRRDFTYRADYGDVQEAAAILGRFYGPKARRFIEEQQQSTVAWRLRIEVGQVRK